MTVLPKEVLNKEFISQFKTEEDVSQFMTDLHLQLLEQLLQSEMDEHLGYEKNQIVGNNIIIDREDNIAAKTNFQ